MYAGFWFYCAGMFIVCIIIAPLEWFVYLGDKLSTYFYSHTIHHGCSREEAGLMSKEEVDDLIARGKIKTKDY